ncbi:hypothetical protein OED52_07865 [Rhodococcus sp. Z13]|uniref:Uncharacterized protein n=1 Tax=Rhodococcus sacchari TaxID=2962047 RepID=A0ACD4DK73_9NOCA|nr:hypothetical protein [Rhodococcus sp. Z13]UYP20426.1 hypothetical protein OED52_07865 [Rhodococcus sp. Z13]
MSILETTLIFVGIPLLTIVVLGGLAFVQSKYAGPIPSDHPYTLDRKWEYGPLLWTATDESTHPWKYPHHGHAVATSAELIGGTASGKW